MKKFLSILVSFLMIVTLLVQPQTNVLAVGEDDPKIIVTPDMLLFSEGSALQAPCTPDKLFDGNSGQGAAFATNSWNSYGQETILVDLKGHYRISSMDLYNIGWDNHTFTVSVGETRDNLREIWTYDGNNSQETAISYDVARDCKAIRYISIKTNGGYFGELELFGASTERPRGLPSPQITIDPSMITYTPIEGKVSTVERAFDFERRDSYWNGSTNSTVESFWDAYDGNVNYVEIDLGEEYNLYNMNVYTVGWVNGGANLITSVGATNDAMREVWTLNGDEYDTNTCMTKDISIDAASVRYIFVQASGGGRYPEIEFYGYKVTEDPHDQLDPPYDPYEPEVIKLQVTPAMLSYDHRDDEKSTPDALFDGVIGTGGGDNDIGWATWNSTGKFTIDLGKYYQINRMDLYTMGWTTQTIEASAGPTGDEMTHLWAYPGKNTEECVSFDVSADCNVVRYININTTGGAYRELELFGYEVPAPPVFPSDSLILVTPDMLTYTTTPESDDICTPEKLFDGGPGQGPQSGRNAWSSWGSNMSIQVDLGEEYNISKMLLYNSSWNSLSKGTLTVSVGTAADAMTELWTGGDSGIDDVKTYKVLGNCNNVRYINIQASGGGYFGELELYGLKVSGGLLDSKISVTDFVYNAETQDPKLPPSKLFDGKPGWGAGWDKDTWNAFGNTSFLIDLGQTYNIKRMNFYNVGWNTSSLTVSAGLTKDDLTELWTFDDSIVEDDAMTSFYMDEENQEIRYIKVQAGGGGYFGELELWGKKQLIDVTKEMLIYTGDGSSSKPENMFDGKLPPIDGGGEGWDLNAWNCWGGISSFIIDLGQSYNISRMDLYTYAWQQLPLTVSAGTTQDDLKELWTNMGTGTDIDFGKMSSYDTSEDCIGVRYLKVQAGSNGYFKELELYGKPASGGGTNGIQITEDMIISGANDTFMKLFDGEKEIKWAANSSSEVILDLGAVYSLRKTNLYRTASVTGSFKVEGGKSVDTMKTIAEAADTIYVSNWVQMSTPALVRYLKITVPGGSWNELQLLGSIFDQEYTLGAITNLQAQETAVSGSTVVNLNWTTPSVNGLAAVSPDGFEIRYSKEEITEENWNNASILTDVPAPGRPNDIKTMKVYGLDEGTDYYFAIKAIDYFETPRYSSISNVATVTTRADSVAPGIVNDFAVASGATQAKFTWTAVGNDGNVGTAAAYKLLYSTEEITAEYLESYIAGTEGLKEGISLAPNMVAPSIAGTVERYTLTGLNLGTVYYFALITSDEKGQSSFVTISATTKVAGIPLEAITNLTATADETKDEIVLNFTSGADKYDIRYSYSPITVDNFSNAMTVDAVVSVNDINITAVMSGANKEGKYYFALKALNNDDQSSDISNIAEVQKAGLIAIENDMVIEENKLGNPLQLVDEPGTALRTYVDGTFVMNGTPTTQWKPDAFMADDPSAIIIDLKGEYAISDLFFYDVAGTSTMNIYTGTPFAWTNSATSNMEMTNVWNSVKVDATTRYIRIEFLNQAQIAKEIGIYGLLVGEKEAIPELTPHTPADMSYLIGTNAFIDDFTDVLMGTGNIREYHVWGWTDNNSLSSFNPSTNGAWDFDAYYKKLSAAGIYVTPVIMGESTKPLSDGLSATNPLAYKTYASHMFQYAARYGSQQVDDSLLKLANGQSRVSGLDYLYGLELLNEQDNNWTGRSGHYTPFENAALMSASYDGHQGEMGAGYGIKTADPNIKVSIGGLAGISLAEFKGMLFWSQFNRTGGSIPMDIYNVHYYSNTSTSGMNSTKSVGVSTEAGKMLPLLKEIVEYRDRYAPGVEVFLSEFGWDTNPESPNAALANDNYTARQVQAQWIARTYLLCSAIGIDQTQQFMIRDTGPEASSPGVFATSGLVTLPDPASGKYFEEKKDSWYYTYTLKNRLGDFHYVQEFESGRSDVLVYQYQNDKGENAYALWCPTSGGYTYVNGFELDLAGESNAATLVELANGTTQGISSGLNVVDGKVEVNISETPILVFEGNVADNAGPAWSNDAKLNIEDRTVSGSNVTVKLSWPDATDEDGVAYYTFYDEGGNVIIPKNGKGTVAGSTEPLIQVCNKAGGATITFPADTDYTISIRAGDYRGIESVPLSVTISTDGTIDILAPTIPINVHTTRVGRSDLDLTWNAATDNVAVAGYKVYNGDVAVTTLNTTSAAISGLAPGTAYSYTVTAFDAAGNESGKSASVVVTTLVEESTDTEAPTIPANVHTTRVGRSDIDLTWNASADNVAVTSYKVYNGNDYVTTSTTTGAAISGLAPGTAYSYTVTAFDAAGNESGKSASVVVTTLVEESTDTEAPTIPANAHATSVDKTSVDLAWDVATDNVAVAGYKVYNGDVAVATLTTTSAAISGLASGVEYSYTVTAFDAAGNESDKSEPVVVTTESGTIISTVTAANTANVGQTFEVIVGVNAFENEILNADISISYNKDLFEYVSASAASDGLSIAGSDTDNAGTVRFLLAGQGIDDFVTGIVPILNLTFRAKSVLGSGEVLVTNATLVNTLGEAITVALSGKVVEVVNKLVLETTIDNAQTIYDEAEEGQYPVGSKAILKAAIDHAKEVLSSTTASQTQIDFEKEALDAAVNVFLESEIMLLGDLNGDSKVDILDLYVVSVNYWKNTSNPDWNQASKADTNGDGKVDIEDLVAVAQEILK